MPDSSGLQRGGPSVESEGNLFRAAQSAFAAAFAGSRIVDTDVEIRGGRKWTWLAQLADGRLALVLVVARAQDEDAWLALDGALWLDEHQSRVRRAFGLEATSPFAAPLVVVVAETSTRDFERRVAVFGGEHVRAFRLVRVHAQTHSFAELEPFDSVGPRAAYAEPSKSQSEAHRDLLATLEHRLRRLDPAVEVHRESGSLVFRAHLHQLARLEPRERGVSATVERDAPAQLLLGPEDVENFAAQVVERYLELGCWTGAYGGVAALALSEPLLTDEELEAFREPV